MIIEASLNNLTSLELSQKAGPFSVAVNSGVYALRILLLLWIQQLHVHLHPESLVSSPVEGVLAGWVMFRAHN
jgi:hypothetical protein